MFRPMRKRGDGRKKSAGAKIGEILRASALMASGGNFERRFNGREGKSLEIYAS